MRVVLDACVLFPPVLRNILLTAAEAGLYQARLSDRILREWVLATARLGPEAMAQAERAAAHLRAAMPAAVVPPAPGIEARLILPDDNDRHVLATAIACGADAIVTFNAADFPRHVLAAEGVARRDPDGFLWELHSRYTATMDRALEEVRARAEAMAGEPVGLRALLRRGKLHRLAKAAAAG